MMGRQRRTKASCFTSRRHRGRQQDRQDGLASMVKGERYKDPLRLRPVAEKEIIVTRTSATDLVRGLQRARPITRTRLLRSPGTKAQSNGQIREGLGGLRTKLQFRQGFEKRLIGFQLGS